MNGVSLATFVATLLVFAAAMLALGFGLLLGRRPIRGSCGGAGGACLCDPRDRRCEASEKLR
jgi:hypothetical protein